MSRLTTTRLVELAVEAAGPDLKGVSHHKRSKDFLLDMIERQRVTQGTHKASDKQRDYLRSIIDWDPATKAKRIAEAKQAEVDHEQDLEDVRREHPKICGCPLCNENRRIDARPLPRSKWAQPQMRVDNEAQARLLLRALKAFAPSAKVCFDDLQDEPRLCLLIVSAADLVSDFEDRRPA